MTQFQEHLLQRGLTPRIRAWVSYEEEIVRFPLWTLDGKLIGYSRYNWAVGKLRSNDEHGRYINKANDAYCMLWGLEHFYDSPDVIFITEGVWDAVRAVNAGYSAVAALTATPSKALLGYFKSINGYRRSIVIADNDPAGAKLKKMGFEAYSVPGPAKDLNDLTQEEANSWLAKLC
jgi:hypothetical protein